MDIQAILPDVFPHYVDLFGAQISQSLIAGVIGTGSFALLVLLYAYYTRHNTHNYFAQIVEMIYSMVYELLAEIGGKEVIPGGITFAVTMFMYILWNNLIGLFGDMVVLVWPAAHHYFRPVTTDVMFNAILAVTAVA
jgi:F0F1-type ATP synthase membrane subunit a